MNKKEKELIKKLADIIEANPNCLFSIDNDGWQMHIPGGDSEEPVLLADSDDFKLHTDWYGYGSNYGFALSEAMIELLNRRGFNITAEAV